jgi:putative hydrolase of HD superfamily
MDSTALAQRLQHQIAFLLECDRLKEIFRQTLNSQSRRRENDAEHSWALCLFAATLAEHSNEPVDVLRVIRMLMIHDLVEIDAGDTFAYDAAAMVGQHDREARAADRIFGLLPGDQALEFRALWDEFEAKETAESTFANALDRMQSMLLNIATECTMWRKHGVTREKIEARNASIGDGSATLWAYMSEQADRAVAAGQLAP